MCQSRLHPAHSACIKVLFLSHQSALPNSSFAESKHISFHTLVHTKCTCKGCSPKLTSYLILQRPPSRASLALGEMARKIETATLTHKILSSSTLSYLSPHTICSIQAPPFHLCSTSYCSSNEPYFQLSCLPCMCTNCLEFP